MKSPASSSKSTSTNPVASTITNTRAAPAVAGWMAVVGLTIHTFMKRRRPRGCRCSFDDEKGPTATWALPGPGPVSWPSPLHKPADALAISTVLSRKGVGRGKLALVQLGFAAMVPIGAGVFLLTSGAVAKNLQNQLTGAALAFSAGTFLFIALSDLLPEVQFHRHDRVALSLALVLGVVLMGGIGLLESIGHSGHDHDDENPGAQRPHDENHHPDNASHEHE